MTMTRHKLVIMIITGGGGGGNCYVDARSDVVSAH